MLPDRCSIVEKRKSCTNPPEFVISVVLDAKRKEKGEGEEYMLGLTCQRHKDAVSDKLLILQNGGKIPKGKVSFVGLRSVGTDCIRSDPNDLIQL